MKIEELAAFLLGILVLEIAILEIIFTFVAIGS